MKKTLIVIVVVMSQISLFGQYKETDSAINKNHLSVELGGVGELYSVNYERLVGYSDNHKVLFRTGLSYLPLRVDGKQAFGTPLIPVGFYYLIGKRHHIELGLNNCLSYTYDNVSPENRDSEFQYQLSPSIGYRFENYFKKSIYYSFAYSPLIGYGYSDVFISSGKKVKYYNWLKIGVGYSF